MAVYDAFISYSHAKDKPIAAMLQSVIQRLGKPWYRRRALRVFRDDTSLSATPHLWPSIERALARSRFLILLASPEAAASPWVGKEIAYWLEHKSADTLLLAVTDGVLAWDQAAGDFGWSTTTPLPAVLKGRFVGEPKWVDLSAYRAGAARRDPKFRELAADFAAAIRGIPKEDLLSEEVRQQRRALTLAWSASASLLALAVIAGWQAHVARTQRDRAERTLLAATQTTDTLVFDLAREFRNRPGIPHDLVRTILERVQALQRQLGEVGETSLTFRRLEAVALDELTTTLIAQNDAAAALPAAERAREILQRLVATHPNDQRLRRDLTVMLVKYGDVLAYADRYEEALAAYREALQVSEQLAVAAPGDRQVQRDLSIEFQSIGDVLVNLGRRTEAFAAYRKALAIIEVLALAEPDNPLRQRDLTFIYERCGNLFAKNKWYVPAVSIYRKALAIRVKLAAANADNIQWRRDIAVSHNLIADVLAASGRKDEAREEFLASLMIIEQYAATDPSNALWQSDLALTLVKLADLGDEPARRYARALAIVRKLESDGKLTSHQKPWIGAIEKALAGLP